MSASECFDFTSEFEIPCDALVVEYPEAVDNRQRLAGHLNNIVGHQFQILLVGLLEK